ncbi:MAG: DUF853 family protein [Propionicimonas sp.]
MTQPSVPTEPSPQPEPTAPAEATPPPPVRSEWTQKVIDGYTFTEPAIELGVLMADGSPVPDAKVRIALSMLNRHGLVAGATGTGKTRTLQLMAEQLSAAGVAVFAADIKGDLSGIAIPGTPSEKLLARTAKLGQDWKPQGAPTEFYALGGQGLGVPLRATVSSFGPILLSKVLGLNQTQESTLGLVFHYADSNGLALLDLADLRAVLNYLTSDQGKVELKNIGGVSSATVGVILRSIVTLEAQGADQFFGEPEFNTADLIRTTADGRGVISLLELPNLQDRPAIFSTFLMWLLANLFGELPEVGDLDRPKLVFFFDEAHLLFADASKAFLTAIAQTVRLIRSKGVGVVFVTQTPKDVPEEVLAQLGSRVQHQLRAHTPNDAKALRATVATYPFSTYDLEQVLQTLGIGEAVVTVLNPDGAPTPVAWTRILAPQASMEPMNPEWMASGVASSAMMARYGTEIDRESAYELLAAKLQAGIEAAQREAESKAWEKQQREEAARQQKEAAARDRAERRTPTRRQEKSWLEKTVESAGFRDQVLRTGGQILRDMLGTARKR